jgi:eukaryotic-like serine/threonine-protein kinase
MLLGFSLILGGLPVRIAPVTVMAMSFGVNTRMLTRARDIFLDALEKTGPAREAFLRDTCGNDEPLRREIEDLLKAHEQAGDFLATPALNAPGTTLAITTGMVAVVEKAGDRIGRYKLLQQIGEGGCGVVYMAEQEEPVRRRVALKIIKLGMDTQSVVARFEAERQALAMMDHPNIAKVFDAGATETGRPYFVMELVRGVRITEYCDSHHLSTEQRLNLFTQVCLAIQHAHQKGIIHRDIKPSNILVTLHDGVPVPKVIDFGIAKATEQRLTEKTLFTAFESFIGTPAYMSPEQAETSGLDIDTRSDIYALGVLLYEMLTGTTPFDARELTKSGLDQCRRTIREVEPPRPSNRLATMVNADLTTTAKLRHTEAPRLIHTLRGDLDWIVMKCLEKNRTRRYATAHDLAQDIGRYLLGDTVTARPPSNVYRLQKLLRKHQRAVAAAAVIAVTLLGGISVSTWQAIRATAAERLAQTAQRTEATLRQRAERESRAARANEYVADINLAQQSLSAGNYGRAAQLLNKHRARPGEMDLRGFEWRYLWQLTRGDEHIVFPTHDEPVWGVATSPVNDLFALASESRVEIWSAATRSRVATLPKGAHSVRFLPDGKTLLAASMGLMRGLGGTVRAYSTESWTEVDAISSGFSALVVSADGSHIAVSTREGVGVLRTRDWEQVALLPDVHGSAPYALSPNGDRLVGESRRQAGLWIWNVRDDAAPIPLTESTNLFNRFRLHRPLTFSPDGQYVVAARNVISSRGVFVVGIWDAATGRETGVMPSDPEHPEHTGGITDLAFSPDGKLLATASFDHSVRVWDFEKRQRVSVLQGHLNEVWAAAFTRDGKSILTAARDGGVKLWPTRPQPRDTEMTGARLPLGFSRDGKRLAALSRQNSVLFFQLPSGEISQEIPLEAPRGPMGLPMRGGIAAAASSDLRTIATANPEGSVSVWRGDFSEPLVLRAERSIALLAVSPDGRTVLTAGWERSLRWWDAATGSNVVTESEGATRALFAPAGDVVAVFGREGSVELWDVAARELMTRLDVQALSSIPASGVPASFSPDGRLLAIACDDDSIELWDTQQGEVAGALIGHKQHVVSVAFAPDGKTLASASEDSTLKLWHVATQQELLTIRRLGGGLRALTFSPDGTMLIAGTSSTLPTGGLKVFRAPPVSEVE